LRHADSELTEAFEEVAMNALAVYEPVWRRER